MQVDDGNTVLTAKNRIAGPLTPAAIEFGGHSTRREAGTATSTVDLERLLYDEWRWQRGLLRRLLRQMKACAQVGVYAPAAQHTWDRLKR